MLRFRGGMLLAEVNEWPEDTKDYFGDGDECHMAFHFPLMPRMYMAIAREDRFPISDIMRQTPPIPSNCQWAIFLRNHDELTLEMVTDDERDYCGKPTPPTGGRGSIWEFAAALAASGTRPPPHRTDEQPAAVASGHPRHLLRG